jgi:hypothetical protein
MMASVKLKPSLTPTSSFLKWYLIAINNAYSAENIASLHSRYVKHNAKMVLKRT